MAKGSKRRGRGDNSGKTDLEAYVTFPGVEQLEGSIINHSEVGVEFKYNRYGSAYTEMVPSSQIIACVGSAGSNECMLWRVVPNETLWKTGKRDRPIPVNSPKQFGSHLIKASSPTFGLILIASDKVRIVGKSTEGSRRGRKAGGGEKKKSGEKRERAKSSGGKAAKEGSSKEGAASAWN